MSLTIGDTHLETGNPAQLPAQVAGRVGTHKLNQCTVRKKIFYSGLIRAARQDKSLLYRHDEPNELTKEGPLAFVLFESPFTSVSFNSPQGPPLSEDKFLVPFCWGIYCSRLWHMVVKLARYNNPMSESTISPGKGLRIWLLFSLLTVLSYIVSIGNFQSILSVSVYHIYIY